MKRRAWLLLVALAGGGCGILGLDEVTLRGLILTNGEDGPRISTPETAVVGEPFEVTVITGGSSSCHRGKETRVRVEGLIAFVAPFDRKHVGDCTADEAPFEHTTRIRFDEPGHAVIIFRGRTVSSGGVLEYEREVVVEKGSVYSQPPPT